MDKPTRSLPFFLDDEGHDPYHSGLSQAAAPRRSMGLVTWQEDLLKQIRDDVAILVDNMKVDFGTTSSLCELRAAVYGLLYSNDPQERLRSYQELHELLPR